LKVHDNGNKLRLALRRACRHQWKRRKIVDIRAPMVCKTWSNKKSYY